MRSSFIFASLACTATVLAASAAHAALGGYAESVASDQKVLSAKHVRVQAANYTDHEVSSDTSTVHEYANASGQIFAVTWRGMVRPDLQQLFGDYYSEYDAENAKIKRGYGRQFTTVKSTHVTVRRGGHMRDINGRAYIPSLVPAGVDAESLP